LTYKSKGIKMNYDTYMLELSELQESAEEVISLYKANLNQIYFEVDPRRLFYCTSNANKHILNYVCDNLSNQLFDYINDDYYGLTHKLDLIDLFNFIVVIKDVELHKNEGFKHDGAKYKKDIERLIDKTEHILSLSTLDEIEITIPQLPHISLRLLMNYFAEKGTLSNMEIEYLIDFFNRKIPNKGVVVADILLDSYNELGKRIICKNEFDVDNIINFIKNDDVYQKRIYPSRYINMKK
jgi:hypothetical protein